MMTAQELHFINNLKRQLQQVLTDLEIYERIHQYPPGYDPTEWNLDGIEWLPARGPRGEYEKAAAQDNHDFRLMIQDLNHHDDRLEKDGFFLWRFRNSNHVGRKPIE
jgi:hypothetical protein